MPGLSKRQAQLRSAIPQRWPKPVFSSDTEFSGEDDFDMDVDY